MKRRTAHLLPESREVRRHGIRQRDSRVWSPRPSGSRGSHFRWTFLGVYRHFRPRALQQNCRGQSQRATSNDGHFSLPGCHCLLDRNAARSPRQGPATSAMPIIVHYGFITDALNIKPRPGCAKRPEAYGHTKNPVQLRSNRHQRGQHVGAQYSGRSRGNANFVCAAAQA